MSRREPAASPFRDLSNLGTPRPNPKPPKPVFTATKTLLETPTPTPHRRKRLGDGAPTTTPLGRYLRALEIDQSCSARRAESGRERALRSFAASALSWLSLLLRDPAACGCSPAATDPSAAAQPSAAGKRGALDGDRARGGRSPKRHRGAGDGGRERRNKMTPAMVATLRDSLREVCSLEDVMERMAKHMSKDAREEVLVMMFQICKNIDSGRLKMKSHCPLATDLRLKEKAIRTFMCYNPSWLRIGLNIIHGGDSLLQSGLGKQGKEIQFLKLILEKHMFSHKKVVEGRRVQDHSEAMGSIILKRIFLFVAALDRAKLEGALPLQAGIDGLDGGSPLLFCHRGQIKSSWQIIQESLGEAMHGEGDLLKHLASTGYKVTFEQPPLSEYDFTLRNLDKDLQNGIILCRIVQLLLSDASIISKVIAPSDTSKKMLSNCTTAIQYIKQARVPLSDSDGVTILAEDIATGDKELILSMLWNVFVHMQLPLLANASLARELTRLGVPVMSMEQEMSENKSHMGLLCDWVQVICSNYGIAVESSSQFVRRALNCVFNHYLSIDIFPHKETQTGWRKELFTCHELDTLTDITSCPSNRMGKVVADVLQDIPGSGILSDDVLFDEKSAILLLAFLSSHLTNDERLEQLKNMINMRLACESPVTKISARCRSQGKNDLKYPPPQTDNNDGSSTNQEWAATAIQTQARSLGSTVPQQLSDKQSNSITSATQPCKSGHGSVPPPSSPLTMLESNCRSTATSQLCEVETSNVISISKLVSEDDMNCVSNISSQAFFEHEQLVSTCTDLPVCKESVAAQRIQSAYRRFLNKKNLRITAAVKIQSHWRCYSVRKCFTKQVQAIVRIQTAIRLSLHHQACQRHQLSAVLIQRVVRGWLARKRLLGSSSLQTYTRLCVLDQHQQRKCHQSLELKIVLHSVIRLQRWWRKLRLHRSSVISIQSFVRGWLARKQVKQIFCCINIIQRWWRKVLFLESRKRAVTVIQTHFRGWVARQDTIRTRNCTTTIQRWWRKVLFLKLRKQSVIVIQAHFRGWVARQAAFRIRQSITTIQSFVKAYLVRKASKQEVVHIRSRLQKSSAQVDDSMRLINRLVAALSQLHHSQSIYSIRQTCAIMSTATEYSKKCCETLVSAGAVDILLNQIPLLNRGIPDQEVKKQVFLTLRNIARYPHLRQVLVNTPESAEIIFQELLRNKADGFFIASDILKKLCESKQGHETARALHHHVKMLRNLVQDLEKKVDLDRRLPLVSARNGRTGASKENNVRRLQEAATLYRLLTSDVYRVSDIAS